MECAQGRLDDSKLCFKGEITIRDISEAKEVLLSRVARADDLALVVEDDALVDLSFVQLIVAGQDYARRHGKTLRLGRPAGGNLRRVLELAGFLSPTTPDAIRFWLHEEPAR